MLTEIGKRAKDAAAKLAITSTEDKNRILEAMANALRENCDRILEANALDIENGRKNTVTNEKRWHLRPYWLRLFKVFHR